LRTDWTISVIGHVAAIAVGLVTISAAKPPTRDSTEWMPVNIVSDVDVTQATRGDPTAAKVEEQKPLVEKIAESKPVEDPLAKVVEKHEVNAARDAAAAPQSKPSETKLDPIAEEPVKEQKKPTPKKAEAKAPAPPKPAPPAPKFDAKKVEALLDKRNATRLAAAGAEPNSTPSLGIPTGAAVTLSLSELDALRQRLAQLWSLPAGAHDPQELVVVFRIKLKPDGRLDGWPILVSSGNSPLAVAARENAARAINRGQPYDMLKHEHYELWKDIEITFDPRDMARQ
jgi:colicin import membrane protein